MIESKNRKRDQLVDLIREIWSVEVKPMMLTPEQQRKQEASLDVPMPVSWLSDISVHIKALREVSDYQAEEVYQCVQLL